MKVQLNYRGQLAAASGAASEVVEAAAGYSLLAIVGAAARRIGGEVEAMVFDPDGEPRRTLLIAVDGEQMVDLSAQIGDGVREITLMPPIAGG